MRLKQLVVKPRLPGELATFKIYPVGMNVFDESKCLGEVFALDFFDALANAHEHGIGDGIQIYAAEVVKDRIYKQVYYCHEIVVDRPAAARSAGRLALKG